MKLQNKRDREPYELGADATAQDLASEQIQAIAKQAGLEVVIISNEDFESMIEHGESKTLTFTGRDCFDFKEMLKEALWKNWSSDASDIFEEMCEEKNSDK